MKYKLLVALITCYTALAFAHPTENIVKEIVGKTAISDSVYTPEAVMIEDHLVVFYQLKDGSNAYYIASGVETGENEGQLIWETQGTIPADDFSTTAFSPTPVLLDGRLYLLGGQHEQNSPARIVYNSVASLADLTNHAWSSLRELQHGDEKIAMGKNQDQLAAMSYQAGLLLTYYQEEAKNRFSYSVCNVSTDHALVCEGEEVNYGGGDNKKLFDGPPLLSMAVNPYLYLRNLNGHLTRNTLTADGWQVEFPYQEIKLPNDKIGAAVDNAISSDSRYIYFRNDDVIKKTKIHANGSNDEIALVLDANNKKIKTSKGVKTIIYRGHIYNFYLDKDNNNTLSYFRDALSGSELGAYPSGEPEVNFARSSATPYGTPSGIFYLGSSAKADAMVMPGNCGGTDMDVNFVVIKGNVVIHTRVDDSTYLPVNWKGGFNPNEVYTLYPDANQSIAWHDPHCHTIIFTLNKHANETTGPTISTLPSNELKYDEACIHGHPSGFASYYKALYAGSETGVIAAGGGYYWRNATFQGNHWNSVGEESIACY